MKGGAHLSCVVLLLCLSTLCSGYESPESRVLSDEIKDDERQRDFEHFQEETERDAPHSLQGNANDDEQLESLNNGEDDANENEEDDNEQTADDTETRLGNIEQENERNDKLDDAVDETPNNENDDKAFFRPRRWWWSGRRRRRTQSRSSSRNRKVCEVISYSGTNLIGKTVRIHRDFQSAMGRIDSYARECSVKIYVTSSFRKEGVPLTGAVVPPASRSNHYIGHAIDMNVQYNNGFCNSGCLRQAKQPGPVSCFIKKIQRDPGLRWGGDFQTKDPVHIDDSYNTGSRSRYNNLYKNLQRNC